MPYTLPRFPRYLLGTAVLISALVGLSAAAVAVFAVILPPKPAFGVLGFELIALLAATLGVLLGLGRFAEGAGLGLVCVAGTVLASAGLGYVSLPEGVLGAVSMKGWVLSRAAAAAGLTLIAVTGVLSRNPVMWRPFLKGCVLSLPLVLIGLLWLAGRHHVLVSPLAPLPGVIKALIVLPVGVVVCACFCAGLHLAIFALQRCGPAQPAGTTGTGAAPNLPGTPTPGSPGSPMAV
ncbi:MAG: hypothetical protein HRU70_04320 [Phycisphaeraceae bacterium]|nr:MAG: hypothetical protein HRU70_04320 [Phycisphaeraceae bacterium]